MAISRKAILCAALASTISSSAAFAPSAGKLGLGLPKLHAGGMSERAGRRASVDTKMDMGVVNTVAGIPLMYALMSANEYVTHRYYQHNEVSLLSVSHGGRGSISRAAQISRQQMGVRFLTTPACDQIGKIELYQTLRKMDKIPKLDGGGHVEHHVSSCSAMCCESFDAHGARPFCLQCLPWAHIGGRRADPRFAQAETYDDMLLKTDDPVWMKSAPAQRLNDDPWRGTIFTWQVTAMMFAQCIPSVYPAFYLLGWNAAATTALFVPAMLLHGLVWNSLHPEMHGLPDVPARIGLPSSVFASFRGSPVFEFLRLNHVGHHVASGKVNYNVCCPGMDHLVGTFMSEAEWTPKIRIKEAKEIEGAVPSSAM